MDTIRYGLSNAEVCALILLTICWEWFNRTGATYRLPRLVEYRIVHESAIMAVGLALIETSFLCEQSEKEFTRDYSSHALLNLACGYPCSNRVKHLLMLSSVQNQVVRAGAMACRTWLAHRAGAPRRQEIAALTEGFIALMRNERMQNNDISILYFTAAFQLLSDTDRMPFDRFSERKISAFHDSVLSEGSTAS